MNNIEIERKFLVCGEFKDAAVSSTRIRQAYINHEGGRTVRVRIRDDKAYLTIKGPSRDGGLSRFEWEIEIPVPDAEALMQLRVSPVIDKRRFLVPWSGHTFEVDEFYGDNEGLTMAEVELSAPDEAFERPSWLGREVTGDRRYYNSHLSRHPFKEWAE
ncbi:MAG: CYTH domain-containing protein [Bacteroidales bacterium]|nr:CYTH domain-containing protein [Bacteroidales bacterium]